MIADSAKQLDFCETIVLLMFATCISKKILSIISVDRRREIMFLSSNGVAPGAILRCLLFGDLLSFHSVNCARAEQSLLEMCAWAVPRKRLWATGDCTVE